MRWIWTGVFITAIVTLCFGAYIFFHQPLQYDSASCVEIRSKAGTDANTLECLRVPGAPNADPSGLIKKFPDCFRTIPCCNKKSARLRKWTEQKNAPDLSKL